MNKYILKKIQSNGYSVGSWLSTFSLDIPEIFSKAGYEWIVVDLEHSSLSINQAAEMIRIIDLSGSVPFVRLTSNDSDQIKRVLDCGAKGIIVPNVKSFNQAKEIIQNAKYPPQGIRGVGLARAQGYGKNFREYWNWQKNNISIIVQIENIEALSEIDKILSLKGIDGFIIGPYDLSCSMGIPGEFTSKKFKEVLKAILDAGKRNNSLPGIHIVEPDQGQLKNAIIQGYKLIAYSVDIRMIETAASSIFKK